VGKPVGVMLGCALALALGLARFPSRVGWSHMAGVGLLAGIGFTVSIFVAGRAFTEVALVEGATIGILFGSVLAGVAGTLFLALGPGRSAGRAGTDADPDASPPGS
jgi:NhaA family Na+:H+ antiporter